jgi:peptidoglycan/LPS O-acetylase OafA/YrhL
MMIGALGAIFYKRGNALFFRVFDNKITQALAWGVILLILINKFHIASVLDNEFVAFVALALIVGQARIQHRLINLENRLCDFLGKISYGLYVIHPIIIFLLTRMPLPDMPVYLKYPLVFFLPVAITIVLAYLSYNYFEKYFLTLKKKFVVVDSSASRSEA